MLQRIQTLYLLGVLINSTVLAYLLELWTSVDGVVMYAKDYPSILGVFGFSALFAIFSIFSYKKRKNQFVLGRFNIIFNFILLGLFVYQSLNLSGETNVSEKGIGMLIPLISIVFLALANKAIKKDEDLVKSVDRIR